MDYSGSRVKKAVHYDGLYRSVLLNGDSEREQLLQQALRENARHAGRCALRAINSIHKRPAIWLAIEYLESPDPEIRANALEILETLKETHLVKPVIGLWESSTDEAPRSEDWLKHVLQDRDPWVRACGILVAAKAVNGNRRQLLQNLAQSDPDSTVRAEAALALLNGGAESMETLQTLSQMERILFLRRVPLFAELAPADLKQVAAIAVEHYYSDGEVIAEEGELGEEMYIIVSGEVRVVSTEGAGKQSELARRRSGEYVGEMSIISHSPRIASLLAAGEVRILRIHQREFEEILRERPETSLAVMRVLCDRLTESQSKSI